MNGPLDELLLKLHPRIAFALGDGAPNPNLPAADEGFRLLKSSMHLISMAGLSALREKNNYTEVLLKRAAQVLADPTMENHAIFQAALFSTYRDIFGRLFPVQFAGKDLMPLYLRKYLQIQDALAKLARLPTESRKGEHSNKIVSDALTFVINNWTGSVVHLRPSKSAPEGPEVLAISEAPKAAYHIKTLSHQIREGVYWVSETTQPLSLYPFFYHDGEKRYLFRMLTSDGAFYSEMGKDGYSLLFSTALVMDLGEFLFKAGDYARAIGLYKLAGPQNREAAIIVSTLNHCLTAQDHAKRGEPAKAASEWELALMVKPEFPVLYHELARDYLASNHISQAVSVMNRLLERFPISDEGYVALGDIYASKRDWGRAQRAYEKALILNPHHAEAGDKKNVAQVHLESRARPETAKTSETAALPEELLVSVTDRVLDTPKEPLVGREEDLEQLVQILSCRDKRNALIVGEAGVGKTALVEALALAIQGEHTPDPLRGKRISSLNLGALVAGARFRGQFEERVLQLIQKIRNQGTLLLVENLHHLVHTGNSRGSSLDSASLIKPALLKGDIQIIGTTNDESYANILEKDPSFLKHFHVLRLEELSFDAVQEVIRQRKTGYERYHGVRIPIDLFENHLDLVRMSVPNRCLPESVLDLMDRTAARVALRAMDSAQPSEVTRADLLMTLSQMSGISFERLALLKRDRLAGLEELLSAYVIGQDTAIESVSRVVRAGKLGLDLSPHRPDGVFLFVGPTGVGKTETARSLAKLLFGDEEKLIRIDMSEYMERISGSRLIGTAPGYVGYYDQNQLTDKVRQNPYCVILFDEVEKADPQVLNLFLQIFDAGRLTDGKGRTVRFNHATIIMTSNVGTGLYSHSPVGYGEPDGRGVDEAAILREVKVAFTPEFLNRLDEVVVFKNLTAASLGRILDLQLRGLRERLSHQGKVLVLDDDARSFLSHEGYSFEYGARNLSRTLRRRIVEPMARMAVGKDWETARGIRVSLENGETRLVLIQGEDQVQLEAEGRENEFQGEGEP
jgi:ATP-dependent Clp protease ATP-binding subunit ClpC